MASRYWVGGTGTWDAVNTANWSATSGGAGGASIPTSADSVFFDSASGGGTCTWSGNKTVLTFDSTGFTGTFAGSTTSFTCAGSFTSPTLVIPATFLDVTAAATLVVATSATLPSIRSNPGVGNTVALGAAYSASALDVTVTSGTFSTNGYALTCNSIIANSGTVARIISLGSSTVTTTSNTFNVDATYTSLVAGTSTIINNATTNYSSTWGTSSVFADVTYYNYVFSNVSNANVVTSFFYGNQTFNNLTFPTRGGTAGFTLFNILGNITVNGTLTLPTSTDPISRIYIKGTDAAGSLGPTRYISCTSHVAGANIDFSDICVTGTGAPITGTSLGDRTGNAGVTFPASKTSYLVGTGGTMSWGSATWSASSGGAVSSSAFPLAQDTVVVNDSSNATGVTLDQTLTTSPTYAIGTLNISTRTLGFGITNNQTACYVYGDIVLSTSCSTFSTGTFVFCGRNTQNITSAGRTFLQAIQINSANGIVALQDAYTTNKTGTAIRVDLGTFKTNNYNVTLNGAVNAGFTLAGAGVLDMGTSTISISGTGGFTGGANSSVFSSSTGVIAFTASTGTVTFTGAGLSYPTLAHRGNHTLNVVGNNRFSDITNTNYTAVKFTASSTTQFAAFNLNGISTSHAVLQSTTTTQATLRKPSTWFMGANSTNVIGNTGLTFTAGGGIDYIDVSYINGVVYAAAQDLFPGLFTNTQTFYSPTVTVASTGSTVSEAAAASDTQSSAINVGAALGETASGADVVSAGASYVSTDLETAAAAETIATSATYIATDAETASAAETIVAGLSYSGLITETSSAADVIAASFVVSRAVLETSSAADTIGSSITGGSSVVETSAIVDSASAVTAFASAVSEASSTSDTYAAVISAAAAIIESAFGQDALVASMSAATSLLESLSAADVISAYAAVTYACVVAEYATALDINASRLLWELIPTPQTPNWGDVGSVQSPGWTELSNTQTANWQDKDSSQSSNFTNVDSQQTPVWTPINTNP